MKSSELGAPAPVPDKPLDEEGYPTKEALARVEAWPWQDARGLMAFVRSIWWAADWGWTETRDGDAVKYTISTGGWSGNEDLIEAMNENHTFWMFFWQSSRRGGHFEFEVRPFASEQPAAGAPDVAPAEGLGE